MATSMKGVTLLGLNAVWQKVIPLEALNPGHIHRTQSSTTFFSGKGGNVAVAMERLGHPHITLVQALGGNSGTWVQDDMGRFNIQPKTQWIKEPTRVCTTLIEVDGRTTELIEPSPSLTPSEWQGVANLVKESLADHHDLLICGSFPGGSPAPLLDALSRRTDNHRLWVDGIREDVLKLSPDVLKINHHELESLVSLTRGVEEACRELAQRFDIPTLVITAESHKVCLWNKGHFSEHPVPPVPKVVNTTGAGDTFFGALVHAHQSGSDWNTCLDVAIAWAGLRCGLPNVEDLPKKT